MLNATFSPETASSEAASAAAVTHDTKITVAAEPAPQLSQCSNTAGVPAIAGVEEPAPKRPRGRPPLDLPDPDKQPTRLLSKFEETARGIAEIPRDIWPQAKEAAGQAAGRDTRLTRSAVVLHGHLLSVLNRQRGYDWHTVADLAKGAGIPLRAAERGLTRLELCGRVLRWVDDTPAGGRGTRCKVRRRGRITLPGLLAEADALRAREQAKVAVSDPVNKIRFDPVKKIGAEGGGEALIPSNKWGAAAFDPVKEGGTLTLEEENPGNLETPRAHARATEEIFNNVNTTQEPTGLAEQQRVLLASLQRQLTAPVFEAWFSRMRVQRVDDSEGRFRTVTLSVPLRHQPAHIEKDFSRELERAMAAAFGPGVVPTIVVRSADAKPQPRPQRIVTPQNGALGHTGPRQLH